MGTKPIDLPASLKGPWVPVMIAKVGEDGTVLRNAKGQVLEKRRLLDARSGQFYNADNLDQVWGKATAIPVGLPIYTACQMIWSAGRFFIDIPAIALKAIHAYVVDWKKGRDPEKLKNEFLARITEDIPLRMKTNLRHFVTAPLFAIGVLATALYGFYDPLEGRKWEAKVEHTWQDHASYKDDFRLGKDFWQKWAAKAFYLAFCFQPLGDLNDHRHAITWWSWRGPQENQVH